MTEFQLHPIYDALAPEGFDPLMDVSSPFDLEAFVSESYRKADPGRGPKRSKR